MREKVKIYTKILNRSFDFFQWYVFIVLPFPSLTIGRKNCNKSEKFIVDN